MGTLNSLSTEVYKGFQATSGLSQQYYYVGSSSTKHRRFSLELATIGAVELVQSFRLGRGPAPTGANALPMTLGNVRDSSDSATITFRYSNAGDIVFSPDELYGTVIVGSGGRASLRGPLLRKGSDDYITLETLVVSGSGAVRINLVLEEF